MTRFKKCWENHKIPRKIKGEELLKNTQGAPSLMRRGSFYFTRSTRRKEQQPRLRV